MSNLCKIILSPKYQEVINQKLNTYKASNHLSDLHCHCLIISWRVKLSRWDTQGCGITYFFFPRYMNSMCSNFLEDCVVVRPLCFAGIFFFFSFLVRKDYSHKEKAVPQNTVWILLGTHYYYFLTLLLSQCNFCTHL